MDNQELIESRLQADSKAFMVKALSEDVAPRISRGMRPVRALLADGQWHSFADVVAAGLKDSDLAVKTVISLLSRLVTAGMVERLGSYSRKPGAPDTRQYRLIDWPIS